MKSMIPHIQNLATDPAGKWQPVNRELRKLKKLIEQQNGDSINVGNTVDLLVDTLFFAHVRVEVQRQALQVLDALMTRNSDLRVEVNKRLMDGLCSMDGLEFLGRIAMLMDYYKSWACDILHSLNTYLLEVFERELSSTSSRHRNDVLKIFIAFFRKYRYPSSSITGGIKRLLIDILLDITSSLEAIVFVAMALTVWIEYQRLGVVADILVDILDFLVCSGHLEHRHACLVSALVNSLSDVVYFSNVSVSWSTDIYQLLGVEYQSQNDSDILGIPLVHIVFHHCNQHTNYVPVRLMWAETLRHCLDRTPDAILLIEQPLTDYIWANWEDPVQSVHHQVRQIFVKMISRKQNGLSDIVLGILRRVLDMSWSVKIKYTLLTVMLESNPDFSGLIVQQSSDIVGTALEFVRAPSMVTKVSEFFFALTSLVDSVLWYNDCIRRFSMALVSEDEILRKHLLTYIIGRFIKIYPHAAKDIVELLADNSADCQIANLLLFRVARNFGVNLARIPDEVLIEMVGHVDDFIRMEAFELGCLDTSLKESQLSSSKIWLHSLEPHMFTEASESRKNFLACAFKFLRKFKAAYAVELNRAIVEETLRTTLDLLLGWLKRSDASPNRVEICLTIVKNIVDLFDDDLLPKVLTKDALVIVDYLGSTYPAFRLLACHISLKVFANLSLSAGYLKALDVEARKLLTQFRPNDLEHGAMLRYLVCRHTNSLELFAHDNLKQIREQLCILDSDIGVASTTAPIQGQFVLARLLFERGHFAEFEQYLEVIESACNILLPILSCAAPEGSMLEDIELDSVTDTQRSSYIMHFCWRVIREASSFLDLILKLVPDIPQKSLLRSGKFLQILLCSIRHMGAFFAAEIPYRTLCSKMYNLGMMSELEQWLLDDLLELQVEKKVISITRRSAGIPLSILAIISAEIQGDGIYSHLTQLRNLKIWISSRPLLSICMDRVLNVAKTPLSEQESLENKLDIAPVHAINIIRTLARDALVCGELMHWTEDIYLLALQGQESKSWAVRNACTMLYTALVSKQFVRKSSDMSTAVNVSFREFFGSKPLLLDYLISILSISDDAVEHSAVFPGCIILSKLYVSSWAETDGRYLQLCHFLVRKAKKSHSFHVRNKAAQAAAQLCPDSMMKPLMSELVVALKSVESSNELHGISCLLYGLLSRVSGRSYVSKFGRQYEMGDNPSFEENSNRIYGGIVESISVDNLSSDAQTFVSLFVDAVRSDDAILKRCLSPHVHPISRAAFLKVFECHIMPHSQLGSTGELMVLLKEILRDQNLAEASSVVGSGIIRILPPDLLAADWKDEIVITYLCNSDQLSIEQSEQVWRLIVTSKNVLVVCHAIRAYIRSGHKFSASQTCYILQALQSGLGYSVGVEIIRALGHCVTGASLGDVVEFLARHTIETESEPKRLAACDAILSILSSHSNAMDITDWKLIACSLCNLLQDDSPEIRRKTRAAIGSNRLSITKQLDAAIAFCWSNAKDLYPLPEFKQVLAKEMIKFKPTFDEASTARVLFAKERDNVFIEDFVLHDLLQLATE